MTETEDDLDFQLQCEAAEKARQRASETHIAASLAEASGTYTDPKDGTVYEWDASKKAWFPKIDDNFLAMYHAAYGVTASTDGQGKTSANNTSTTEHQNPQKFIRSYDDVEDDAFARPTAAPKPNKKQKKSGETEGFASVEKATAEKERKAKQDAAAWFDISEEHNRNVYVSNLPSSTTEEELLELMSKCGVVMKDPRSSLPKLKLYKNVDGKLKGDALCTYMKVESIPLALQILDGYPFKDKTIKVERARFSLKGQFNADIAKKQKLKKGEKKRLQKMEAKLLDWRPDKLPGQRPKNERIVVIKNMFDPVEFEEDPSQILEFKRDLQEECSKFGEVKKVVIHDRHPEGIATVGFAEFDQADACIARLNGRWFSGRQLAAAAWDGKTKYKIEETEEEMQKRLQLWEKHLGEGPKSASDADNPE